MEGYSEPAGSQQQTSGTPTVLGADGDARHLEDKLVAHYHTGPLGATSSTQRGEVVEKPLY